MDEKLAAKVRNAALGCLGLREHTTLELTDKICKKLQLTPDCEELQFCLVKLTQDGDLSDNRYAEMFVRSRKARGYGPIFIEQEMRQRGLDKELISDVVNRANSDWNNLAFDLKRKKFGSAELMPMKEKAKAVRFLRYKGFLSQHVEYALRHTEED
jgi:regulatory protein